MISKTLIFVMLITFFFTTNASAERYYYKGAAYTGGYYDALNGNQGTRSSVVVLTASTVFTNPSGKERVRAFTRCEVINGLYNSYDCGPDQVSVRLAASTQGGSELNVAALFPGKIYPEATVYSQNILGWTWFIGRVPVGAILQTVEAIANAGSMDIDHSRTGNDSASRVIFNGPSRALTDVPTSVAYDDIDSTYGGQNKGVMAYFPFQYDTNGGVRYLTAKADATYTVRIDTYPNDPAPTPPLVLQVKTGEASLTHSIGY